MIMQARCSNRNHMRSNAPVRFCPTCGEVVNEKVPITRCTEEKHQKSRRETNEYCVDCGKQLIQGI
jgi:rRNA maturation protein Nop10